MTKKISRESSDDNLYLRENLIKYVKKWPYFLLSILVATACAFVVVKFSKPTYQIKATLVIDDKKDKAGTEKVALQELDLIGAPKTVENEIEILKSHKLIKDAVDHLNLSVDYKLKDGILENDLYGVAPFRLNLYRSAVPDSSQKLKIQILNATSYLLLRDDDRPVRYGFNQVANNEVGTWSLSVVNNIKPYIGKTITVYVNDSESTVIEYQKALTVELVNVEASVIDLSINDVKIKRGEDFINTLIYFYNQSELADKNNITQNTIDFIDKRLDSLHEELNNAEGKVEGYQSGNGLTDINAQSAIFLQDDQSNGAKLNDINIQLAVINQLETYVNSSDNNESNIPSTLGISDQGLIALLQKLSDLQLQKTQLLATLPEKNPAFEPINKQISQVKSGIKESIKNIKSSLLTTRDGLKAVKTSFKSSIHDIPTQERQLGGLKRQQSIKENLYTYLLQQREEISLSYASPLSDARLVDLAYALPPKSSKKLIPFVVALFLGLVFPAGLIYGREKIKNSVNNTREIEAETMVPIIAEINYLKLPSAIVTENPKNNARFILTEQFRNLRTQLNFISPAGKTSTVTLITSSVSGEGKSFISNNLAISLAKLGKKVALLEIDVYRSKAIALFGLQENKGLADYLAGKATLNEIIQYYQPDPNLAIIGSGEFVDDFSELLNNETFEKLLNELKEGYDHILIDSPPLNVITEGLIIGNLCDNTLYVVREGYTPKTLLPFIEKLHTDQQIPDMHIVFNGVETVRSGYKAYYPNNKVK